MVFLLCKSYFFYIIVILFLLMYNIEGMKSFLNSTMRSFAAAHNR